MNDFEKHLDKLQSLEHNQKKIVMWVGVLITMAIVVFIWVSYMDFSFKNVTENKVVKEEVSKWQIFKNGLKVTIQDAGELIDKIKDKAGQTNSFEIKTPETELVVEETNAKNQEANIVQTLRIDAVFQDDSVQEKSILKIEQASTTSTSTAKTKQ